jgi:hypothetical protein
VTSCETGRCEEKSLLYVPGVELKPLGHAFNNIVTIPCVSCGWNYAECFKEFLFSVLEKVPAVRYFIPRVSLSVLWHSAFGKSLCT